VKQVESKRTESGGLPVDVILIVPFGVKEELFPWGVHALKYYFEATGTVADVTIIDFHSDDFFAELNNRYADLLSDLFFSLNLNRINTLFGTINNPYVFLGFIGHVGEDFFKLTGTKCPSDAYIKDIQSLQEELNNHICQTIDRYTTGKDAGRRIWGLSVYDRTLFNSLYIAGLIKERDPGAEVILGGDCFNDEAAEETFYNTAFVDGVIVGYGEEPLRKIIMEKHQGHSIAGLSVPGLVNGACRRGKTGFQAVAKCPGPTFGERLSNSPVSYVQPDHKGVIRILSQRGCSWGKCSFCTQLDKGLFYPVPAALLAGRVREMIQGAAPIRIHFDSDENCITMLEEFMTLLNNDETGANKFEIVLWVQVKKFRKELAEVLAKNDKTKINIQFKLNFESLNPVTLRHMRKGHSPLQAIEAAKAVLDTGYSFVTNYFIHFPLGTHAGMASEAEILGKTVHLLGQPRAKVSLFPYESNNRDSIFENQDRYKIRVKEIAGGSWLKRVFDIDLPFSLWAYHYDERPSFKLERLLNYAYYKTIKTRLSVLLHRSIAAVNWPASKLPFKYRILLDRTRFKLFGWNMVFYLLWLTPKGKAFRKRKKLLTYFSAVTAGDLPTSVPNLLGKEIKKEVQPSQFALRGKMLVKEYNVPGAKEKWQSTLAGNEIKILRYLYWSRKQEDVFKEFNKEIGSSEIEKIISRHLELGSLISFKGLLLCTVNDPGYWR
jgi:hypothetical protein